MKDRKFAEFRVGDLFEPLKIKKYSKKPETVGLIPFVSCQTTNNGISSYCDEKPEIKHCITVSTNGNCFDCFWHNYPIIPSIDVEVLSKDGITDDIGIALYLCSVLSPHTQFYSYSNKPKGGKVFNTIISLPVKAHPDSSHVYTVEDIDWQYMQDTIKELDMYLKVTGLDDYELTDEDKKILSLSRKSYDNQDGALEDNKQDGIVRYGEFRVGDLFDSVNGDTDIKKIHINNLGLPVISSGVDNRGIIGCSDIVSKNIQSGSLTVDMFGNCFYRDFEYKIVTHARVFNLIPKNFTIDSLTGLYFESRLKWCTSMFSYDNMCSYNKIKDMNILLPVVPNIDVNHIYTVKDIDWNYIRDKTKAIQKLVIADVVKYKNDMIETTKKVVNL